MSGGSGRDVWSKEYNDVKEHADELYELIRERNALLSNSGGGGGSTGGSGSDAHRLSAQCRRKLGGLSNKITRLEEVIGLSKDSGTITQREAARRTELVHALGLRRDQLKDILSNRLDSDRKRLLNTGSESSSAATSAAETDATASLDARGILSLQKQALQSQDAQIDELGSIVSSTKHVALAINEEADLHQRLLDDLEDGVDHSQGYLRFAQRKLRQVSKKSGSCKTILVIIVLVIILAVLVSMAMHH